MGRDSVTSFWDKLIFRNQLPFCCRDRIFVIFNKPREIIQECCLSQLVSMTQEIINAPARHRLGRKYQYKNKGLKIFIKSQWHPFRSLGNFTKSCHTCVEYCRVIGLCECWVSYLLCTDSLGKPFHFLPWICRALWRMRVLGLLSSMYRLFGKTLPFPAMHL